MVAADQRTTNKFKHSQEFLENKFEIDDLIETRDHENEELICLAKVTDKDVSFVGNIRAAKKSGIWEKYGKTWNLTIKAKKT